MKIAFDTKETKWGIWGLRAYHYKPGRQLQVPNQPKATVLKLIILDLFDALPFVLPRVIDKHRAISMTTCLPLLASSRWQLLLHYTVHPRVCRNKHVIQMTSMTFPGRHIASGTHTPRSQNHKWKAKEQMWEQKANIREKEKEKKRKRKRQKKQEKRK